MLLSFGLLSDDTRGSGKAGRGTVNPHQSALNKLMQYGQASRATKTCGSYGAAASPTVSCGLSGNMHPSQYVPMERCESGSHHAATKERALIATGRPVQPHDSLPSDYAMPSGHTPWQWVPLLPDVAQVLQLSEGARSPDAAEQAWPRAAPNSSADPQHDPAVDGRQYYPDEHGFSVELPDGVRSQVRFRLAPESESGFEAEWRISSRNFPTPEHHDLQSSSQRVMNYFDTPHRCIELTTAARSTFESYMGAYNVKGHMLREAGDVHGGARLGAAPWQLGMLAAALCVFDIFTGRYEGTTELTEKAIRVQAEHIVRGASLLGVVHKLKEVALLTADDADDDAAKGAHARAQAARERELQYLQQGGGAFDGLWSQSAFAHFPLGQSQAELATTPVPAAEVSAWPTPEPAPAAGELPGGTPGGSGQLAPLPSSPAESLFPDVGFAEGEDAGVDAPGAHDAEPDMTPSGLLTEADVKSMAYGCGPDGASVQQKEHARGLTDRRIMQRTLLCGLPACEAKVVCDKMASPRQDGRKALPQPVWSTIMRAGAQDSNIVWYRDRKLYLRQIPQDASARVEYHNELMRLCALPLRDLVEAMQKAKGKDGQKRAGGGIGVLAGSPDQLAAPGAKCASSARGLVQAMQKAKGKEGQKRADGDIGALAGSPGHLAAPGTNSTSSASGMASSADGGQGNQPRELTPATAAAGCAEPAGSSPVGTSRASAAAAQ